MFTDRQRQVQEVANLQLYLEVQMLTTLKGGGLRDYNRPVMLWQVPVVLQI